MLSEQNRLKKKKDFEKVFKRGKGYRKDFLFLKTKNNDLDFSRFGFVVSKKISNKAVVRNKVKRQLREIVRKKILKIKKGIDAVIITMPGIESQSFQGIEETIDKIFAEAKILKC